MRSRAPDRGMRLLAGAARRTRGSGTAIEQGHALGTEWLRPFPRRPRQKGERDSRGDPLVPLHSSGAPSVVLHAVDRGREDNCRHRLPDARQVAHGIGRRRVVLACRSVGGHQLVHPATVERRVERACLVVEPGVEVVVDRGQREVTVGGLDSQPSSAAAQF